MKKISGLIFCLFALQLLYAQAPHAVKHLKITVLSTMLANSGLGEWGFSALVEADGTRILFDTGSHDSTVLKNSRDLKLDLSTVPTLILSHNHDDHTTGWLTLRKKLQAAQSNALQVTHVAPGFLATRMNGDGTEDHHRHQDSIAYAATKGSLISHDHFTEIFPGIYLTGPVPRRYPETNYNTRGRYKNNAGEIVEDNIPEDMSLVIRTEEGLVLLSGCGHSGIINNTSYIQEQLHQPIYTAIGGFHLFNTPDDKIQWTAKELKAAGIKYFMGAHCTGIEPVYQIREWAGLKRGDCRVGAVGDVFESGKGFIAAALAR